ncbi:glutamate--tRNA ligase, cytoplasmic, partial [Tanacetum coccineum]
RNAQYFRIQEDMGLRKNGKVDGWDDAHFPTVQGIVRRGLQVEALIQFILEHLVSYNLEVEGDNIISNFNL